MELTVAAGFGSSLFFEHPHRVWAPSRFEDALAALHEVEDALDAGYWIAGAISYEFGAQLQGIATRTSQPLLLLGAFENCGETEMDERGSNEFTFSAPLCRISQAEYALAIDRILGEIRDGEVYQVNYTVPFDAGFGGDPFALFRFLCEHARAPYSAYVDYGDLSIVSISPELFLRFEDESLTTKPMKGTAPLPHVEELASAKNRAEHVMIVDLLRNDLHRVCGDVQVRRLFEIERYPTFATMTSTICGTIRPRTTFAQILQAAFPCGSVTGAPKRAAMQHIAQIERFARGFYTGSIGFLSPQRRGWWNVPIRTLQIDRARGTARYDAGGGIVSDSSAIDEWNEILVKSRFLQPAYEDFALLETYRDGREPSDVQAHLERLQKSAQAFNLDVDVNAIHTRLCEHAGAADAHLVRVRANSKDVQVTVQRLEPSQTPVDLCVSRYRVRSDDPLLRHKTAWRPVHEEAAAEARERGCFDAILQNERGELTEGARTNIFVRKGNTLYTPPLECGVLPGILRSRLISEGQAVERVLTQADLGTADEIYAGNSARGLLLARIR